MEPVLRRYRFALRPGWVALHLLAVAMVVTMILLGRWQLIVSNEKHFNIRNFGYALQWWAFSAFTAAMWVRVMRDRVRRDHEAATGAPATPAEKVRGDVAPPVAYRRYVPPKVSDTAEAGDETLAAYNDYLARLHSRDGSVDAR